MKKFLLFVIVCTVIFTTLFLLTSCELFGSNKEKIEPPSVEKTEILKDIPNYTESTEYLYNKDKNLPMPLYAGDEFILSIEYHNKKKYAISYVTLATDEGTLKIVSSQFESGSTKTKTLIRLQTPSNASRNSELTYKIKNICYNTGSEVKRITLGEDVQTDFTVKISPSFRLVLDKQNADNRASSTQKTNEVTTVESADFGSGLGVLGVADKDYQKPDAQGSNIPQKAGGWIFEGYYTEPYGNGVLVKSTDTYYFWSNVTLYAHFSRAFSYTLVNLDKDIYDPDTERTYSVGVKITGNNNREYPYADLENTIVDEKVTINENTGRFVLTYTEYPVVEVGEEAYKDANKITRIRLGKFIERIGYRAFYNCNAANDVTFLSGKTEGDGPRLQYIGDFAFADTTAMGVTQHFTLPETVTYLGNMAFRNSGWKSTMNNQQRESVLHIRNTYKFIGVRCFYNTGFDKIVFDPGCHFESQISYKEGLDIIDDDGWKDIRPEENRIGAELFAKCANISAVEFLTDENENNALNIIPDRCFDANRYQVNQIETLIFAEGIELIGAEAFNYQEKLPSLLIPATVKEIGSSAFYNCSNVITLTFAEGSVLEILHSRCFGNLSKIDRVQIISTAFYRYGNGPFQGCKRLKSIEFPNLRSKELIPRGFERSENNAEVLDQHLYSDFLFGTFDTGSAESGEVDETDVASSGYSMPTRIFCRGEIMEDFKDSLLAAKATYVFKDGKVWKTVAGPSQFRSVVFVHNIDLVKKYENPGALTGEDAEVQIALQEIYEGNDPRSKVIKGYSLVYWSYRSKNIVLPDKIEGLQYPIIELAMYSIPTSVQSLTIPASITRLEHDALNGCSNLETIRFINKDTLEYIGDYALFGTQLTSFVGGSKLRVIGEGAFRVCRSLKWVDLSATEIIHETEPTGKNLRDTAITQYKYDYEPTENKTKIDHKNGLFDGAFYGCTALKWIYLPKKLQQIANAMFTNCRSLECVIMDCTLKTRPGDPLFNKQTDHQAFYVNSTPSTIFDDATVSSKLTKFYVPDNLIDVYKLLYPRAEHKSIMDMPAHP